MRKGTLFYLSTVREAFYYLKNVDQEKALNWKQIHRRTVDCFLFVQKCLGSVAWAIRASGKSLPLFFLLELDAAVLDGRVLPRGRPRTRFFGLFELLQQVGPMKDFWQSAFGSVAPRRFMGSNPLMMCNKSVIGFYALLGRVVPWRSLNDRSSLLYPVEW